MDYPKFIVSNQKEESISIHRVNYDLTSLFSFGKYDKCCKILITFLFLFSNKMYIISARIFQKQSDLDLRCLSGPFWKATSVWKELHALRDYFTYEVKK